ncbi:hypothetical protein RD792_014700 [Penstemon davidsonii]|uniref:(S)-2-hydroxy-acid oxidase n=1 Tax=Penstemon davidsonii TaxID=160366 RepID=A0ABR0CQX3_9LAMI|nr:hypothetical protein RD792_014700 [Penstemon davidsonii]
MENFYESETDDTYDSDDSQEDPSFDFVEETRFSFSNLSIKRDIKKTCIANGDGEKKYPASSFVLNCKGDACTGDVVIFEQNVYEMFNIASRSANGPPCGTRVVAGRIVKESYGAAKQQHTFTIEVLWSKGEKPLPPLHPLLIKGRNLYRLKTMRQKWQDEGERYKILSEKHARGGVARLTREERIQHKEMRKSQMPNNRTTRNGHPQRHKEEEKGKTSNCSISTNQPENLNIVHAPRMPLERLHQGQPLINMNDNTAINPMLGFGYNQNMPGHFFLNPNVASIRPRILIDVSRIDMSTTILGYKTSVPIIVAPTGLHKLAHPQGEIATARASVASNVIMVYKRREISAVMVQRAERNGFKAIILTADVPRLGRREADIKNKMIAPRLRNFDGLISTDVQLTDKGSNIEAFASENFDASLCWKDIGWLKSITSLPILIKGILTREDAIRALEVGVAGIVVSNHGARQLDYSPATINVLEEVVVAVEGKIPVFVDGGVRRGTDIFKALALGARAVMIGRPVIYGLAAMGAYGVRRVINMLKDELELTMTLSGCCSLKDITRGHVRTEQDGLLHCKL